MSMSDPLADMLTRIRNAANVQFPSVEVPLSKLKMNIAKVLKEQGYITDYHVIEEGAQGTLKIDLKCGPNNEHVITGIRRASKPGRRQYKKSNVIPKVMSGLGIGILTTSKGVMSDKQAREQNVGGEMICEVW